MTPFGARLRTLREERGITLKFLANALQVSAAYLSALEHGHRGQPTFYLVQRIIGFFNVIWDEAEELERLAGLSHPRAQIDTAGLPERATELANLLAQHIRKLEVEDLDALVALLRERLRGRISD